MEDHMLKWFEYEGMIDPKARTAGAMFSQVAHDIAEIVGEGPERTVALRKLLESRDATMRALHYPGG